MQSYAVVRYRNVMVCEEAVVQFPSPDEAIEAVRQAHLADHLVGYDGKAVPYALVDNDGVPVFNDATFQIDMHTPDGTEQGCFAKVFPALKSPAPEPLRDGYVSSDQVLAIVEELADLDPDWPLDMRRIRSLCADAKVMKTKLLVMGEYE